MNKKIFCNKLLIIEVITFILYVDIVTFISIIWMCDYGKGDVVAGNISIVVMVVVLNITIIACSPRYFAYIILKDDHIEFGTAFSKKKVVNYSSYGNIYIANYTHLFLKKYFIVLSQIDISMYELTHINQILPSNRIIKVSYNKKVAEQLLSVLPSKQKRMLEHALKTTTHSATPTR